MPRKRHASHYPLLGHHLTMLMRKLKLSKWIICSEQHVGGDTYARFKKGSNLKISYYIHFVDYLWNTLTEEEFRQVISDGLEAYILHQKKCNTAENETYRLRKQQEQLEELKERMKGHKDIL